MSGLHGFDLCRAAMAAPGVTAPERSVLMVLAIMANAEAKCWPPINDSEDGAGLTSRCVLSERAVQRAIQQLVKLGYISRRQLRHGVIYTVHPVVELTPVTGTGVSETARPATQTPKKPKTTTSPASPPKKTRRAVVAFVPPSDIPEAEWEGFEEMRRRIGKPMTSKARDLAIARLRRLAEDGYPPGDVLNHSTLNNYQGLFPPKDHRNADHRTDRGSPHRPVDGFTSALRRASAKLSAGNFG